MAYVLLIYIPDGTDIDSAHLRRMRRWVDELEASGKLIFQSPFFPAGSANYMHCDGPTPERVDGPVSDEMLVVQGAEFVKCSTMEEALELAGRHPAHHHKGARVEVRKIWRIPPLPETEP